MKYLRIGTAALAMLLSGVMALAGNPASNGKVKTWTVDVTKADTSVLRGHLNLGGTSPAGGSISVNSRYIVRDGMPMVPVIGEFHYSRYPEGQWEQEIQKMKTGGVTVIATYVFWDLHEKEEGHFDWSGNLDLRHFVELCGKNGVDVIVRVGPFDHGEMRSGGFPDWLYGRPIEVRSNDPQYLSYVERLYGQIGNQLRGLFYKDGGPIIGIQIENEYQHSAAPWGFTYDGAPRDLTVARRDVGITHIQVGVNLKGNENSAIGQVHMQELKRLAVKAGLISPLYTATGWGFATIIEKGSIPVMSCYAYPSWEPAQHRTPFFLYKDICSNPDYAPVSYNTDEYPSIAAELGTGMMPSWSRRTFVPQESMLPMMVRTIGSGSNGLGYYMYHGGTTPSIGNYFYTEGFGLSLKSYDYQAPLGEYGRPEKSYRTLKLINYFLSNFGDMLAPLPTVLPDQLPSSQEDIETLRWAARSDGDKGFVFMHNFQDHVATHDLEGNSLSINTSRGTVTIPSEGGLTLKAGSSAILPFNMEFNGVKFASATVQPLCKIQCGGKTHVVFFQPDGMAPEIVLEGKHSVSGDIAGKTTRNGKTRISLRSGKTTSLRIDGKPFLVLSYDDALNSYLSGDHLYITDGIVSGENGRYLLTTSSESCLGVYPAVKSLTLSAGTAARAGKKNDPISEWKITLPSLQPDVVLEQNDDRHFTLDGSKIDWDGVNEIWLRFNYKGDRGMCMMGGQLQTDDLYNSRPWTVGLKRYASQLQKDKMYFYFLPMQKGAPYLEYLTEQPDFGDSNELLDVSMPEVEVEQNMGVKTKCDNSRERV